MVLREFKICEKNILVSLSHSLKTSVQIQWKVKWNEKPKAIPFSSHEQWVRTKDIHVLLAISWHKSMLQICLFFLSKAAGKLKWSTEEFQLHSLATKEIIQPNLIRLDQIWSQAHLKYPTV